MDLIRLAANWVVSSRWPQSDRIMRTGLSGEPALWAGRAGLVVGSVAIDMMRDDRVVFGMGFVRVSGGWARV